MEELIGTIKMFAGDFAPVGWMFCQGQILQTRENLALYSVLGNRYGGNGNTTFALPDFRGLTPIGVGRNSQTHNYSPLGVKGGKESIQFSSGKLVGSIPALTVKETGTISIRVADDSEENHFDSGSGIAIAQQTGPSLETGKAAIYRTPLAADPNNTYLHEKTVDFKLETEYYSNPKATPISIDYRPDYMVVNFIIAVKGDYPQKSF